MMTPDNPQWTQPDGRSTPSQIHQSIYSGEENGNRYGHHFTRGNAAERNVITVFNSSDFTSWLTNVRQCMKNDANDQIGKDLTAEIRHDTFPGIIMREILGRDEIAAQVKSSKEGVDDYITKHTRHNKNIEEFQTNGIVVVNGHMEDKGMIAMDVCLQTLNLSGNLFEPEVIGEFFSVLNPNLRRLFRAEQTLAGVLEERRFLLSKINKIEPHDEDFKLGWLANEIREAAFEQYIQ